MSGDRAPRADVADEERSRGRCRRFSTALPRSCGRLRPGRPSGSRSRWSCRKPLLRSRAETSATMRGPGGRPVAAPELACRSRRRPRRRAGRRRDDAAFAGDGAAHPGLYVAHEARPRRRPVRLPELACRSCRRRRRRTGTRSRTAMERRVRCRGTGPQVRDQDRARSPSRRVRHSSRPAMPSSAAEVRDAAEGHQEARRVDVGCAAGADVLDEDGARRRCRRFSRARSRRPRRRPVKYSVPPMSAREDRVGAAGAGTDVLHEHRARGRPVALPELASGGSGGTRRRTPSRRR